MEKNKEKSQLNIDQIAHYDRLIIPIENRILTLRSKPIIIDRDLAELYNVETKALNQAVKRNIERFPESFRFQLTDLEKIEPVTNCDRFNGIIEISVRKVTFQHTTRRGATLHLPGIRTL